jgi:hypothetical protein
MWRLFTGPVKSFKSHPQPCGRFCRQVCIRSSMDCCSLKLSDKDKDFCPTFCIHFLEIHQVMKLPCLYWFLLMKWPSILPARSSNKPNDHIWPGKLKYLCSARGKLPRRECVLRSVIVKALWIISVLLLGACGSAVGWGTLLQVRKHVMNYNKEKNMKSDL